MSNPKTPSREKQLPTQETSVKDSFNRFAVKDYSLNPHTSAFLRQVYKRYGLALLLYIVLILLIVLINLFQVENVENVYTRLQQEVAYPFNWYTRCPIRDDTGHALIGFYKKSDVASCENASSESEPLGTAERVFLTVRERAVFLLIRHTVAVALPILFSVIFSTVIFLRFVRNTPKVFLELAKAGRLKPPAQIEGVQSNSTKGDALQRFYLFRKKIQNRFNASPKNWGTFADDLEKSVQGLGGKVFFVLALIISYVFEFAFANDLDAFGNDFWANSYYFVILGLAPIVLGYGAGYGIWILFIIATFIRKLTVTFDMDIQPDHGDLCGGLKRLGDLCFEMATILIFLSIVVAAFVLLGFPEVSIPAFQSMVVFVILVLLILATMVFFLPLLGIHGVMVKTKEALQDEATSRIAPVKARLRELVGKGKLNDKETQNLDKQLEKLIQLYPANMEFPTWPFTARVILIFYTSQILPIITVITGLVDFSKLFAQK